MVVVERKGRELGWNILEAAFSVGSGKDVMMM